MIQAIPAIDIIGGKCVRLTKGDYAAKTEYSLSPVDVAKEVESLGYTRLHVVDLDGARSKHVVNDGVLRAITQATHLTVDFGGGLKTSDDIAKVFDAGAALATVGSVAVQKPELLQQWISEYGADRIVLGADVRNGFISINGWQDDTRRQLLPFLQQYVDMGVSNVLCTDISKDGTLSGPAIALYREVMTAYPQLNLIASGGVSSIDDIKALDAAGIPAVVFGKAIYEGHINLKELWHWLNASYPA